MALNSMELLHQGFGWSIWIDVRTTSACPLPLEEAPICLKCGETMRWWICGGHWYCMCDMEGGD